MNCCTTAAQKLRILGRSARGFRRPVMTYGCFQNREDDSPQRGFRIDFAARKDDLRRLGASRSLRGEHSEPPPGGGCGSRGSEEPQFSAGTKKYRLLPGSRRCNARGVGFTGEYRFVRPVRRGSPPSTPPVRERLRPARFSRIAFFRKTFGITFQPQKAPKTLRHESGFPVAAIGAPSRVIQPQSENLPPRKLAAPPRYAKSHSIPRDRMAFYNSTGDYSRREPSEITTS